MASEKALLWWLEGEHSTQEHANAPSLVCTKPRHDRLDTDGPFSEVSVPKHQNSGLELLQGENSSQEGYFIGPDFLTFGPASFAALGCQPEMPIWMVPGQVS